MLLKEDRTDDAITVFKRNTELYSEDVDLYDSLGEADAYKGGFESARANYNVALEMNPRNVNAVEILRHLAGGSFVLPTRSGAIVGWAKSWKGAKMPLERETSIRPSSTARAAATLGKARHRTSDCSYSVIRPAGAKGCAREASGLCVLR